MAVKAWEAEQDLAKQEHCWPAWSKPKLEGIEEPFSLISNELNSSKQPKKTRGW